MPKAADTTETLTIIRTDLGAIFVSLARVLQSSRISSILVDPGG
jgi:hypothetical protein